MKRTGIFVIPALAFILAISGCAAQTGAAEKGVVRIGITTWPGYAYAFIAQEKGFFKQNGVDVELVVFTQSDKSYQSYASGKTDGFMDPFQGAIFATSEGISPKVVYVFDYSDEGDVIIGRPEFNSIADLKGKKVAFEGVNSFSHMLVLKLLERSGINEGDVSFENIPAQELVEALDNGDADAGHTWEPAKSAALSKGYKILGKAGDIPGLIVDVLVLNEELVEERPQDVKGIVKSLLQARDYYFSNKEESLGIMSQATGSSREDLLSGIDGVQQPGLYENMKALSPNNDTTSLFTSGAIISDFFIDRGQLSQIPDLEEIIEDRFIEELSAEWENAP